MRAGTLRHVIDIQEKVPRGTGDRGQPLHEWATIYESVPAQVEPLAGQEQQFARQLIATATHTVTCRYLPAITSRHRIKWGDAILDIGAVLDVDGMGRELQMACTNAANV